MPKYIHYILSSAKWSEPANMHCFKRKNNELWSRFYF